MWTTLKDFVRRHSLATAVVSAAAAGFTTGGGLVMSLYESSINRIEERKLSEFNDLMAENSKFLEGLNVFTEEVGTKGKADPAKRSELSSTLARLYTQLDTYAANVPGDGVASIRELQTSVNEVKKKVQTTKRKQDLDPLGVALVAYFENLKQAQPVIEATVGKSRPEPLEKAPG